MPPFSAQARLASLVAQGHGVEEDLIEAHFWANIAASQGSDEGLLLRDELAKRLSNKEIDRAQQMAKEWRPGSVPTFSEATPSIESHAPDSTGTAFVVKADGFVLTNAHVVNSCQQILIQNGISAFESRVVKIDQTNDLALLHAETTFTSIRRSHPLVPRSWGNPS